MQIVRKTEEIIYPSSNAHPTLFRLSETDQLHHAIPALYFYKQGPASSQALKNSLSKTLTFFYPLAGRLLQRTEETAYTGPDFIGGGAESEGVCTMAIGEEECETGDMRKVAIGGRMDVSCLDQGALFCEAWTDTSLNAYEPDFVPQSDFTLLRVSDHDDFLLRIQVTHFLCGGLCLCVQGHHCLLDGASCVQFMMAWVEITNGEEKPSIYPYMTHPPLEVMYGTKEFSNLSMDDYSNYYRRLPSNSTQEVSYRIFYFSPQFIDNLKSTTSNESHKYSSFECLTAFIWKNLTLARGIASNEDTCLYYPVDGRGKLIPPLQSSYFGNAIFRAHASVRVSDLMEKPLSYIANALREATSKITNTHIQSVLAWSTRQTFPMSRGQYSSPHLFLNSWTRFPLWDYDFGWGKPLCMRRPSVPMEMIIIIPSSSRRGYMELLVGLNKDHNDKFYSLMSQNNCN